MHIWASMACTPGDPVDDAYKKAARVIKEFIREGAYKDDRKAAQDLFTGWALVWMSDEIAELILEASGFPLEVLEVALDNAKDIPAAKRALAKVVREFEAENGSKGKS